MDREFFKTYKKVFDLKVVFEQPQEVKNWKNEAETGNEITLTQVSASKVKNILTVVADVEPPMVEWKDKAGNDCMVAEFDWEDKYRDALENVFVEMTVTGEGLDTKYNFSAGKEFAVKELTLDEIPF